MGKTLVVAREVMIVVLFFGHQVCSPREGMWSIGLDMYNRHIAVQG